MRKRDVEALYHEVKRRKVKSGNRGKQSLIEQRTKKRCNCGSKKSS